MFRHTGLEQPDGLQIVPCLPLLAALIAAVRATVVIDGAGKVQIEKCRKRHFRQRILGQRRQVFHPLFPYIFSSFFVFLGFSRFRIIAG